MTDQADRSSDSVTEFDGLAVMLVEDNDRLRGLIARTLESLGCVVTSAPDAAETIRLLEDGCTVRLILSDVRMPGSMDGIALAEWVSARFPAVAILLITGFAHTSNIRFPVLNKPFGPEELLVAMQEVLGSTPVANAR